MLTRRDRIAEVEVHEVNDTQNKSVIKITWDDGQRLVLGDSYADIFADQTEVYKYSIAVGWEEIQ
jgi:hypothetical protein